MLLESFCDVAQGNSNPRNFFDQLLQNNVKPLVKISAVLHQGGSPSEAKVLQAGHRSATTLPHQFKTGSFRSKFPFGHFLQNYVLVKMRIPVFVSNFCKNSQECDIFRQNRCLCLANFVREVTSLQCQTRSVIQAENNFFLFPGTKNTSVVTSIFLAKRASSLCLFWTGEPCPNSDVFRQPQKAKSSQFFPHTCTPCTLCVPEMHVERRVWLEVPPIWVSLTITLTRQTRTTPRRFEVCRRFSHRSVPNQTQLVSRRHGHAYQMTEF